MPLIRYKIGDIGIPGDKKCPCGRGLPLMEKFEGRAEDFIKVPDGKVFAPTIFFVIMRNIRGIKQYRIVQEKIDKLLVYLVPAMDFNLEVTYRVQQEIRKILKNNVHIEIKIVDELPRDPSGKLRSVISKVPIKF
jgi:phenylacetate-CoA ligase